MTYSDHKVTLRWVGGGGGWKVATNFSVSFKAFRLMGHPLPILADPCLTLA